MKAIEIQNLDQHLKPLQVDGVSTGIEISTKGLRFTGGDLQVDNITTNSLLTQGDFSVQGSLTLNNPSSGHGNIYLPNDQAIEANTNEGNLTILSGGMILSALLWEDAGDAVTGAQECHFVIQSSSGEDCSLAFYHGLSNPWRIGVDATDNSLLFGSGALGSFTYLTLSTTALTHTGDIVAGDDIAVSSGGQINLDGIGGHTYIIENSDDSVRFVVGGTTLFFMVEGGGGADDYVSLSAGAKLFFDSAGNTYIREHSADHLRVVVGGDLLMSFTEQGDDGNQVQFNDSSVGFTQLEPTYDATTTIVDFRFSNKQNLTFGAGNITNTVLTFPAMSGNFRLLLKQDGTGSRTITNWKAAESDESAADGSGIVVWAGGSAPTLTTDANHVDILSFYWDNDNEIAYGVASLDFQF